MRNGKKTVAIVDYGMGNLFSVQQACVHAGLEAVLTNSAREIQDADAVILPGVGAFGDAMKSLTDMDLVGVLRDVALSDKLLVGICLGMQLFMSQSLEFGEHRGLNILEGKVLRFTSCQKEDGATIKVPQVGWNRIHGQPKQGHGGAAAALDGIEDGEFMYFVHSYYVVPDNTECVLTESVYGDVRFASSAAFNNNFICQFHPERSGGPGLRIYQNIAALLNKNL